LQPLRRLTPSLMQYDTRQNDCEDELVPVLDWTLLDDWLAKYPS
jgi:hypothetical protein